MPSPSEWTFGLFRLDTANACLWRGEQMLALRPKAFAVLAYLITHTGQLVTKEALFDAVWPGAAVSDPAVHCDRARTRVSLYCPGHCSGAAPYYTRGLRATACGPVLPAMAVR